MEINPLKYLNIKRTFNALKIIASFTVSKVLRRPIVWGMPITYSIEPTNYCNLKCPECPSGTGELTRHLGFMSLEKFKQVIDQISDSGFYVQLFFQGEPYLNKMLNEMIGYAQSKNIYVSVSTNGNLITEKNIDKLMQNAPDKMIFSLDGLDEETYQNYRVGGTFKKADDGLKLITDAKKKMKSKKPFVELQFIVMKQNEYLLDEVQKYGKLRDVDRVLFKTMQVSSYENALKYLPTKLKYSRYSLGNNSYKIKSKIKNHCFALWRTAVITWDNKMVPCCFDKDAVYELGNLNNRSIKEVWNSEAYNNFRKGVLSNRQGISMCNNCTEGLKVNIFQVEN